LGANGVSVPTTLKIYRNMTDIVPIREVIFAASLVEMRDAYRSLEVPTSTFNRYVLGHMTLMEEFTYRDIPGLISYWSNWKDYHNRTSPASMAFSKTGSVPLDINGETSDPRLWNGDTIVTDISCQHCVDDFAGFCKEVRAQGHPFTIVLGPIRAEVLTRLSRVRSLVLDRRARIGAVAKECGASLFDIAEYATLDDSCFANSIHLNARGMRVLTQELLQVRRGERPTTGLLRSCNAPLPPNTSRTAQNRPPVSRPSERSN
jgi:hypothetical protein